MNEFEIRRNRLLDRMDENSVCLLFSGVSKIKSEDSTYPFLSNRHFYYLTGIEQENSMLILIKGICENHVYLFVDEYNEIKEKWTGKRLTFDEARYISGVNNVNSTNALDSILSLALVKEDNQYGAISTLYLDLSPEIKIRESTSTNELANAIRKKYSHLEVKNIYEDITRLRMIKSKFEVDSIKEAIKITQQGINNLIINMKVGQYEYFLADNFEFYGRSHNRTNLAFDTIVASGKNALCLHYPTQNSQIKGDDLVLFDLGFAHKGYAADISRTYPISGTFNEIQRDIYEAVLNCNKALIEYAKPGLTLLDLQNFASDFLRSECIRLGLMDESEDIRKYYYHSCSHHLGLDTHDCAIRSLPLEPGNVITIEPGLYFANHGIGVRVEDDILITSTGAENLSIGIQKEINDIERLFKMKG